MNGAGKNVIHLIGHELKIDRDIMTRSDDACFRLRVLVRHDSMDPDEISSALGIEPSSCCKAGEHVVTPKGKMLSSIHNHTSWSRSRNFSDRKSLSSEFHALIEELESASTGLSSLAKKGCDMVVLLDISGEFNVGSVFSRSDLKRLLELHVGLGLEVFPGGL